MNFLGDHFVWKFWRTDKVNYKVASLKKRRRKLYLFHLNRFKYDNIWYYVLRFLFLWWILTDIKMCSDPTRSFCQYLHKYVWKICFHVLAPVKRLTQYTFAWKLFFLNLDNERPRNGFKKKYKHDSKTLNFGCIDKQPKYN